jgi:peptidoglycan hydrolase CwlO-like protein
MTEEAGEICLESNGDHEIVMESTMSSRSSPTKQHRSQNNTDFQVSELRDSFVAAELEISDLEQEISKLKSKLAISHHEINSASGHISTLEEIVQGNYMSYNSSG